jgi:hypothetical protein
MAFDTAGQIISDALVEVGLAAVSDPFSETEDSNVVQMCTLLKSVGREILHQRQWTYMRAEHTFTTVQGQSAYDLPDDFHEMVDQSGWNRTNRLPLGGPLSAQEWQYLKSRLAGVVFTVLFRPWQGQMHLYPDTNTPGGYDIAFEYISDGWVEVPNIPVNTYRDYPTESTDIIRFDSLMVSRGLKLAWLKAHGFDTTSAQQDYTEALNYAMAHDSFQPILSLTRQNGMRPHDAIIGQQSVPITGFGS